MLRYFEISLKLGHYFLSSFRSSATITIAVTIDEMPKNNILILFFTFIPDLPDRYRWAKETSFEGTVLTDYVVRSNYETRIP